MNVRTRNDQFFDRILAKDQSTWSDCGVQLDLSTLIYLPY